MLNTQPEEQWNPLRNVKPEESGIPLPATEAKDEEGESDDFWRREELADREQGNKQEQKWEPKEQTFEKPF